MSGRTKVLIASMAALVVAAAAVVVVRARGEDPLAQLDVTRDSVEIQRAEAGEDAAAAAGGEDLSAGDRITTDDSGLGTVNWFDGSLTRLGRGADFTVEKLSSLGGRQIVGRLDVGASWHRVQEVTGSDSRFEVGTNNAVAAVRGTKFLVTCLPNCRFGVVEGLIEVVNEQGESETLDEGEQLDVDGEGNLGEPQPLDPDDPWLQLNQELDSQLEDDDGDGDGDDDGDGGDESEDGEDGEEGETTSTTPSTQEPTTTTTDDGEDSPFDPGDDGDGGGGSGQTTATGTTIPPTPPTSLPPPLNPPGDEGGPTTSTPDASSTTSPSTTSSSTTQPETTTSAPSSTTSSTSSTSTSTSTSSTSTSTSTSTTSSTSTTEPPATTSSTSPPATTGPITGGGGGGGTTSSTSTSTSTSSTSTSTSTTSTTEPTTTTTTVATASVSGAVIEPADVEVARLALVADNGVVLACPSGATGDVVCDGGEIQDDGSYSISGLAAGSYDVFAVPPESRTDLEASDIQVVELEPGEHAEGVDLVLKAAGPELFLVTGTVFDHTERPVAGATVDACPALFSSLAISETEGGCATTTTDKLGGYSFRLPAGDFFVEAFSGDTSAFETVTMPTESPLDLFLSAPPPTTGSISGTVVDPDGPVAGAEVSWCVSGAELCSDLVLTGSDGGFLFSGLDLGTYDVFAAPGPGDVIHEPTPDVAGVTLTEAAPDASVELQLSLLEPTTSTTLTTEPTMPTDTTVFEPPAGAMTLRSEQTPIRAPRHFGSRPGPDRGTEAQPETPAAPPRQPRHFGTSPAAPATTVPPAPPPPPRQPRHFGTPPSGFTTAQAPEPPPEPAALGPP